MEQYLVDNEQSFILFMRDVFTLEELRKLPFSVKCKELLEKAFINNTFKGISEGDAKVVFKEFIEPIAAGDISLEFLNPIFIGIKNPCVMLIHGMPLDLRNKIYC
ncbi:hypothetical protein [Pseudobutyrivibrio ruminis]|uniref:Uncharacterized protein n=1 Tax=Pseudobutyrivibrio ruminis TaxID=46206 RepID=A0A2G3DTB5_9FIRM|nr:hypothetical protein [Pseudobutyrivibrio ruminis]PHU34224.1 hypothetical protein CSX01_11705 [Pseudobutyrivibrio ruminis]